MCSSIAVDVIHILTGCRARTSPTHIAFSADSRLKVRDCYAAALNAGGRPSGAPSYRKNDCSCFNAAVEDLDGNTIEFIFREPCGPKHQKALPAPSEHSNVLLWQKGVVRSAFNDEVQSVASRASRTKSRAQTALDLASSASKPMKKSEAPTPGIHRSYTEPVAQTSEKGGKAIVGTLLGAAAGAAFAYAMCSSERDNARDEAAFAASMRSKAPSVRTSRTHSNYEKSTVSKPSRGYSSTESYRGSRHPPRSTPRMIEPAPYDDYDVQDVISRYTSSRRPMPQRSKTYDAIEYPSQSSSAGHGDRFNTKRASTMPLDRPDYYIEGTKSVPASRHTSRRGSLEDHKLKRHDSGVSMHSHRSHRSFEGGRRSSASKASTVKPSRRGSLYESAADITLPQSKATSYISAAQVSMPPSRSGVGYTGAAEESDGLGDMQTVLPEDSISCIDFSSKRKESKSRSGSSKTSRHGSKRSEADSQRTVRPVKPSGSRHSAQTLPVRSKDDYYSSRSGKRSTLTYV